MTRRLCRETPPLRREAGPEADFSRTLDSVQGNARLAEAAVPEEAAAALDARPAGPDRHQNVRLTVIYERHGRAS
jgi:hypothetical protein